MKMDKVHINMNIRIFLSVIIALVFISFVPQDLTEKEKQDFFKEYTAKSKETNSIECKYIQEKVISHVKDPIVSNGDFYFSKPGNIRWEQTDPTSNIIVLKSDSILLSEEGKIRRLGLNSNPYYSFLKKMMVSTVSGDMLMGDDFELQLSTEERLYVAKLIPKSRKLKRQFSHIVLKFDKVDLHMSQMVLYDKSGDYTSTKFINPIFNKEISKAKFQL